MRCSYCNKNNKDGALFCKRCGIGLPQPGPAAKETTVEHIISEDAAEHSASEYENTVIETTRESSGRRRHLKHLLMFMLFAIILFAVVYLVISLFVNRSEPILAARGSYTSVNGAVICKGSVLAPGDESVKSTVTNLSGSTGGLLTGDGFLYSFVNEHEVLVSGNITRFISSASGSNLIYEDQYGYLWSYACGQPDRAPICICNTPVRENFVVSPDGRIVLFNKVNDSMLYMFKDGVISSLKDGLSPISAADSARHIYAFSEEENALYHIDKRGALTFLRSNIASEIYLNSTHDELVFSTNIGDEAVMTMLFNGNGEPMTICNSFNTLAPIPTVTGIIMTETLPSHTVYTFPYKSFEKKLFCGAGIVLYSRSEVQGIEGLPCSCAVMSDDYKLLYYISDGKLIMRDSKDYELKTVICDDCINFAMSSNGQKLWCLSSDNILSYQQGSKVSLVAPNVSDFAVHPDGNQAIYLSGGIACRNIGGNTNVSYYYDENLGVMMLAADKYGLYGYTTDEGWSKLTTGGKKINWHKSSNLG